AESRLVQRPGTRRAGRLASELDGVRAAELREHLREPRALGVAERAARLLLKHVEQIDRPAGLLEVLLDLAGRRIGDEAEVHHAGRRDDLDEDVERGR